MKKLEDYIRTIPDFPEPGIMFRDITTVFQDADGLKLAIDSMQKMVADLDYDVIVGAESRGFIYGAALAYNLHKPLILVRKKGKLPWKTIGVDYDLEYGKATLEMHVDAIQPGQKALIVEDFLNDGGTARGMVELMREFNVKVVGMAFVMSTAAPEKKRISGEKALMTLEVTDGEPAAAVVRPAEWLR